MTNGADSGPAASVTPPPSPARGRGTPLHGGFIDVCHADDLDPGDDLGRRYDLAVVIDVVRAFTVAPWILRQGAVRLFLSPDPETALRARSDRFSDALLLKDGRSDPRFDLPNAPGRIAELDLTGRTVIQTTGNGTRGAHLVRSVPVVACASFSTASATARLVGGYARVLLVPTEGDEDHALADFLIAHATGSQPDLEPLLQRVTASTAGVECAERGPDPAYPGVHPRDLDLCRSIDTFDQALLAHPSGELLQVTTI